MLKCALSYVRVAYLVVSIYDNGGAEVWSVMSEADRYQRQRAVAYRLWWYAGEPDNQHDEFWYQAGLMLTHEDRILASIKASRELRVSGIGSHRS